jgi:hypothetical protein
MRQVSNGKKPSDVKVALVVGVHRNFVRRILANPPRIPSKRGIKSNHISRLLNAWQTDPAYLDSKGKPGDLPEKGDVPSFYSLSSTYIPSASPGVVLSQLRQARLIQSLSDHRVRISHRPFRAQSVSASIDELTTHMRELFETLRHNTMHPNAPLFSASLPKVAVKGEQASAVNKLICRRASGFLVDLQRELASKIKKSYLSTQRNREMIGLAIYQTVFDCQEK